MIQLPFHKWTLSFINQEYEKQYEREQNSLRLFNFRLLYVCLSITCFACLIVFVAQSQPLNMILLMTVLTSFCFFFLIFSSKLAKYLIHVFTLCFILSLGGCVLISLSAFKIPQFMHGFDTCVLVIFILQHTDNKVKFFVICGTPIILLEFFSLYELSTLQYITFSIGGALMIGVLLYQQENNQRVCFSIKILNEKQMDIIDEYLNDPLLAISFNKRTRQFELEFMNKQLQQKFAINDTESMKDFLRNTSITSETNLLKSTETQNKKSQQITTEEFLYEISENYVQEDNLLLYSMQKKQEDTLKKIIIKKINYGKPILLILIKCQQLIKDNHDKDKQFQVFKNTITEQLQNTGQLYQQLLQGINTNINLESMALLIFNQVKNIILYINQDKLQLLSRDIRTIPLSKLLYSLNSIFTCLSMRKNKNFQNINTIEKEFLIKLNTKFLTQILINIFEFALNYSQSSTTIILQITQQNNLQTLQNSNNNNEINQLIKFAYSFSSIEKISNPFSTQEQQSENQQYQFSLQGKINLVTNQLLSYLEPHKTITFNQEYERNEIGDIYLNEIYFYIYQYQPLEESYKQNLFGM